MLGDPTGTAGANMTKLLKVRNVGFDWGLRSSFTSNDAVSGVPLADGIFTLASQPECQADLQDHSLEQIEALIMNLTKTTGTGTPTPQPVAAGVPDTFAAVTAADVPTLGIIPVQQQADGIDADNAIWLPAVTIQGANGLSFGRVDEGEIDQGFNVSFQGAYRDADQADAAIPAGNRVGWMGPPTALGLAWSIPSLT